MTQLTHDFNVSVAFLRRIYPRGPWMLTAISVDKKAIESRTFSGPEDEEQVRAWLNLHKNRNLYYSVNTPIDDARESKKLKKSDVARVYHLHVDVDPRATNDEGKPCSHEDVEKEQRRILAKIQSYPLEPSEVVFSGGGYNALWTLEEPVDVAENSPSLEETLRRAIDVERRNWQFELDFETVDHCRDVSRILRLPGTINRPNEEKIKKGRVPTLSRVVSSSGRRYPLGVFAATPVVGNNQGSAPDRQVSSDIQRIESVDHLPKDVPDALKVIIVQGHDPTNAQRWSGDRSQALFYVCCELVRCEVPDAMILGIITDRRFGIAESVVDKGNGMMRYALRQINRAKDKAHNPKLAEFNDKYAVIANYGGRCLIMIEEEGRDVEFMRPSEFFKARDHEKIVFASAKSGKEKVSGVASWWFDQRRRRQYEHVCFEPGLDTPQDFNLWRGFGVDSVAGSLHHSYLEHVYENICSGNQEHYDYLIKWCARVFQQPRTQSMVAPVLLGKRGTGKSVFTGTLVKLLGKHAYVASSAEEVTGRFNAHLHHTILLIAEEAFEMRDKRHESVLKERITGRQFGVERKGVDVMSVNNYLHVMMTSNNEKVVPAGDYERRFLVIRVGDAKLQDADYFKRIIADLDNGGYQHLLHHLLTLDIADFNVTAVPQTAELRQQQQHNLAPALDWLLEKLETGLWFSDGRARWEGPIAKELLHNDYLAYCERIRVGRPMSARQFSIWMKKELPLVSDKQLSPQPDQTRPWAFVFPSLVECRQMFLCGRGWKEHPWLEPLQIVRDPAPHPNDPTGQTEQDAQPDLKTASGEEPFK